MKKKKPFLSCFLARLEQKNKARGWRSFAANLFAIPFLLALIAFYGSRYRPIKIRHCVGFGGLFMISMSSSSNDNDFDTSTGSDSSVSTMHQSPISSPRGVAPKRELTTVEMAASSSSKSSSSPSSSSSLGDDLEETSEMAPPVVEIPPDLFAKGQRPVHSVMPWCGGELFVKGCIQAISAQQRYRMELVRRSDDQIEVFSSLDVGPMDHCRVYCCIGPFCSRRKTVRELVSLASTPQGDRLQRVRSDISSCCGADLKHGQSHDVRICADHLLLLSASPAQAIICSRTNSPIPDPIRAEITSVIATVLNHPPPVHWLD